MVAAAGVLADSFAISEFAMPPAKLNSKINVLKGVERTAAAQLHMQFLKKLTKGKIPFPIRIRHYAATFQRLTRLFPGGARRRGAAVPAFILACG